MFYLKEALGFFYDQRLKGLAFFFLTIMLAAALNFRTTVQNTIARFSPEALVRPYFTAVIEPSVEFSEASQRLGKLPEVARVESVKDSAAQAALTGLLASLGNEYVQDATHMAGKTLRVLMRAGLPDQRAEAVRQALISWLGSENVTASAIKQPEQGEELAQHPILRYLSRFGAWGVIAPLALCWVIAFVIILPRLASRAWLIERFQRRRYVRAKILAAMLAPLILVALVSGLVLQGLDPWGSAICLGFFLAMWSLTMGETKWRPEA